MFPVLASIGGFTLSSFGLFLLLAFIAAFFVMWRIIRLYDIDPERIIDLSLFTFISGVVGARVYFVLTHLAQIDSLGKAIDIYRFPGFSFWGGLIIGGIALVVISRHLKLRLWQVADIAMTALFMGIAIGSVGCFLGSCDYGNTSTAWFAINQSGLIGKRLPLQIIQVVLSLIVFWYLWKSILKFHFDGQIAGWGLIALGVIKLMLEPFRPAQAVVYQINLSYVLAILCVLIGIWVLYSRPKKSLKQDLSYSIGIIKHQPKRRQALSSLRKWWYNLYVATVFSLRRLKKKTFKILHVKTNPDQF